MRVPEAFDLLSRAVDAGRAAGGYLVCGDLRGQCDEFVALVLEKLFPGAQEQIASRSHPDVFWLEPQGRSRTIKVERPKTADADEGPGMRDGLVDPMSETSFCGGWKVGVVYGADRMQPAAANAFLKTLEEPPPMTMFLLLTDAPEMILPTIVSRTQRIDLPLSEVKADPAMREGIEKVMAAPPPEGTFARSAAGRRLAELLGALKDEAEPEDVAPLRKAFFRTLMDFVRRWMKEGRLPAWQAFRNVEAVEEAYRRSEKFIADEPVLCSMMDRIFFPR